MNYAQLSRLDRVENNAGGLVFALDPMEQLTRFLILGSDSPTYYSSARALTIENAQVVIKSWMTNPQGTIDLIRDISINGRAPKNDPAIFALALGVISENLTARQLAFGAVSQVCRTATHLFQFVQLATELGKGWGRGMKRAVSNWYDNKSTDALAYQMVKYRERHGFNHNRTVQLSHPTKHPTLYQWVLDKPVEGELPNMVKAFELAKTEPLKALEAYPNMPWEALPTEVLNNPKVWETLVGTMPLTALMRNLGRISGLDLLTPLSPFEKVITHRFQDEDEILRAKLHPYNLLVAQKTYGQGRGFRGSNVWNVNQNVVAAMEDAYYLAFGSLEPSDDRTLIGLDVSGSMNTPIMTGSPITCREASAAMAMVTARTTPSYFMHGFSTSFVDLGITRNDSLPDVIRKISHLPFAGTDCSVPMDFAIHNKLEVDKFVIYTDNETHGRHRDPAEALKDYRKRSGIKAKLVVVGMSVTNFTIADPKDRGMLDVVGFDTAAPNLIAGF